MNSNYLKLFILCIIMNQLYVSNRFSYLIFPCKISNKTFKYFTIPSQNLKTKCKIYSKTSSTTRHDTYTHHQISYAETLNSRKPWPRLSLQQYTSASTRSSPASECSPVGPRPIRLACTTPSVSRGRKVRYSAARRIYARLVHICTV